MGQTRVKPVSQFEVKHKLKSSLYLETNSINYPISSQKYLRKEIRPPHVMCQMLDDWFARFKCTASSDSNRPAMGRLDPQSKNEPLFTVETKTALLNCNKKSHYLQDPLPLEQMYEVISPNPNSSHGLNEYLSRRGESNLESCIPSSPCWKELVQGAGMLTISIRSPEYPGLVWVRMTEKVPAGVLSTGSVV
jgi:hypothetical protein